jgi:hypothetical protein
MTPPRRRRGINRKLNWIGATPKNKTSQSSLSSQNGRRYFRVVRLDRGRTKTPVAALAATERNTTTAAAAAASPSFGPGFVPALRWRPDRVPPTTTQGGPFLVDPVPMLFQTCASPHLSSCALQTPQTIATSQSSGHSVVPNRVSSGRGGRDWRGLDHVGVSQHKTPEWSGKPMVGPKRPRVPLLVVDFVAPQIPPDS